MECIESTFVWSLSRIRRAQYAIIVSKDVESVSDKSGLNHLGSIQEILKKERAKRDCRKMLYEENEHVNLQTRYKQIFHTFLSNKIMLHLKFLYSSKDFIK